MTRQSHRFVALGYYWGSISQIESRAKLSLNSAFKNMSAEDRIAQLEAALKDIMETANRAHAYDAQNEAEANKLETV